MGIVSYGFAYKNVGHDRESLSLLRDSEAIAKHWIVTFPRDLPILVNKKKKGEKIEFALTPRKRRKFTRKRKEFF